MALVPDIPMQEEREKTMTTPPTPEAVEAAMEYMHEPIIRSDEMEDCARILAAEVERLRAELGHAQEQLERIRSLCMGHGVGLRDDVLDVVG